MVKRAVRVKVVVTEQFKVRRTAEVRAALAKLDGVGRRLSFQLDAMKRAGASQQADPELGERLRAGQRNNERARAALVAELEKIAALAVGDEFDRGVLEGMVEVEVGDDFAKLGLCEIVVKDDKIVEIRDGLCLEASEISS